MALEPVSKSILIFYGGVPNHNSPIYCTFRILKRSFLGHIRCPICCLLSDKCSNKILLLIVYFYKSISIILLNFRYLLVFYFSLFKVIFYCWEMLLWVWIDDVRLSFPFIVTFLRSFVVGVAFPIDNIWIKVVRMITLWILYETAEFIWHL